MAFYQKYRPRKFAELIGEDHVRDTLLEAAKSGKLSHAYLLCGPRGIGKTTTARLLAKAFNCPDLKEGEPCDECEFCQEINQGRAVDVIEIDAASHTKVDEIREVIDKARVVPTKAKKKVYIIDEVHMLSVSSFNALLKTLEEPPAHAIFILATTEVHKIPATVLSRVQRFDFKRVSKKEIIKNLRQVAEKESIKADEDALEIIALNAEGSHRDSLSLLEQISSAKKDIKKEDILDILGISEEREVLGFVRAIFNNSPEEGLKIAHSQFSLGKNMPAFLKEAIEYLRQILLYKICGQHLSEGSGGDLAEIEKLASGIEPDRIGEIIKIFIDASQFVRESLHPLLPIEMATVKASNEVVMEIRNLSNNKVTEDKTAQNQTTLNKQEVKELKVEEEPEAKIETAPVEVVQMTDDLWERVITETKKENATLAALLKDAKPLEIGPGKIKLGVKFAFHKDKISEPKNCSLLEKIVGNILGQKCKINCELSNLKKADKSIPLSDNELQKAAEEIFAS